MGTAEDEVLDKERTIFYSDVVYACLNEVARKELEKMEVGYQPRSEFAKKFGELCERRWKILAEGRAEGEARGEAQGKAQGEVHGRASALLTLLAARGLAMNEAQQERILTCTDLEQLNGWIQRSIQATSVDELLGS